MNLPTLLQTFLFLSAIIFHVVYTFQFIKGIANNVFKSYSHLLIHNYLVLHTEMTLNETKKWTFPSNNNAVFAFLCQKENIYPFPTLVNDW